MSVTFQFGEFLDKDGWSVLNSISIYGIDVNVSNTNAIAILERLGYGMELCGEEIPEEFLGRVLVANVGRHDDGVRPSEVFSSDGVFLVGCGRRPEYFQDVMEKLAELALIAKERDMMVVWS